MRRLLPLCDKIGRDRIEAVVHDFYERLRVDPVGGPYFRHISEFRTHEARICEFWWIAMGGRSPRPPTIDMVGIHQRLQISEAALERWLTLFDQALQAHLPSELAAQWALMATALADKMRSWGIVR